MLELYHEFIYSHFLLILKLKNNKVQHVDVFIYSKICMGLFGLNLKNTSFILIDFTLHEYVNEKWQTIPQ